MRPIPYYGIVSLLVGNKDGRGNNMNGYDMMCDLADYLGEWAVLDALAKYLPNDDLVEAMEDLARDYDYSFDGK